MQDANVQGSGKDIPHALLPHSSPSFEESGGGRESFFFRARSLGVSVSTKTKSGHQGGSTQSSHQESCGTGGFQKGKSASYGGCQTCCGGDGQSVDVLPFEAIGLDREMVNLVFKFTKARPQVVGGLIS